MTISHATEQTIRLQLAALCHRKGFAAAVRETGLSRHQLTTLAGGFPVHRATLVQAHQALAMTTLPTPGDL